MKKGIGIAVAIIIVVLIIIFANRSGEPESTMPELVSMTDGQNTVVVSDQDQGESVSIALATLVNPGYVVIHADADGTPGEVIGHSELLVGVNENVRILLNRPAKSGERLYAMLHSDDEDGIYTFPGPDAPIKDQDGQIVLVPFKIVGATAESKDEQVEKKEQVVGNSMDGGVPDLESDVDVSPSGQSNTVDYSDFGFEPKVLTIKKGDKVTFKNLSSRDFWPASNIHPTHTLYPGSDIQKCKTSEAQTIFDACRGLANGESYTFIFNKTGSWGYHDHLNPSKTGTINVE